MCTRTMWEVQIEQVLNKDDYLFAPLVIFMEIVERSANEDVVSLVEEFVDLCNALEMTVPTYCTEVSMWLRSIKLDDLDPDQTRIHASLMLHEPTQAALEGYLRRGYQVKMGDARKNVHETLAVLESKTTSSTRKMRMNAGGIFEIALAECLYYAHKFDPESSQSVYGRVQEHLARYMALKAKHGYISPR